MLSVCMVLLLVTTIGTISFAGQAVTIRLAFWGGVDDVTINTNFVEAFEKIYPNIKVELNHIPSNYDEKMLTMMAGGEAPDVIELAVGEGFTAYASKGTLVNLEGYIQKENYPMDDFFSLLLGAYQYQGETHGIPMRWGPMILYYNKTMFDNAGIEYPTAELTWDDFVIAAREISKAAGPDKFGFGTVGGWWPWWMSCVYQNGGRILDETNTKVVVDEKLAEAFDWYADLIWKYHAAPTPEEMAGFTGMGPDQLFESGIAAMNTTGFWAVWGLRQIEELDWDISVLPKGKERATPLFSNCWAMTTQSKHPEAAWKLIKYLTGPEGQKVIATSGHDIPARKSIAYSAEFLEAGLPPENLQSVLAAADHIYVTAASGKWNEINSAIGNQFSMVLAGKITGAEALEVIKAELEEIMK